MRTTTLTLALLGTTLTVAPLDARDVAPTTPPTPTAALRLGPPWISIELPPSPYGEARGAFLVVHSKHHGTPMDMRLSGRAEGLVRGERRTIPLQFTKTSITGAQALRKQWPSDGVWTLVLTAHQSEHPDDVAQAVVELDARGAVHAIRVPTRANGRGDVAPVKVVAEEIERGLRARAGR